MPDGRTPDVSRTASHAIPGAPDSDREQVMIPSWLTNPPSRPSNPPHSP